MVNERGRFGMNKIITGNAIEILKELPDYYAGSTKGRKKNGEHSTENSKSGNYYGKFNDKLLYKTYPGYKKKI